MANNREELHAFLRELNERRDAYTQKAPALTRKLYGREKGPKVFNDSSFLYIRSFDGDIGVRPFGNILFWNSPDIQLTPVTGTTPLTTNSINAGHSYRLQCQLHNRGDVMVPYPKVEFFLTVPTLGFDVRVATRLGATQMNGLLMPDGNGSAELIYDVPATESGHKCLFARTFSFSPLDKPYDVYNLDPRIDRHIAQKNLNIVAQSTPYMFNLVHLPNANERIDFVPMAMNEAMALNEPLLANFKWKEKVDTAIFREANIEVLGKTEGFTLKRGRKGFEVISQGKGPSLAQQEKLTRSLNRAVAQINAGKAHASKFKELFLAYRTMNDTIQATSLQVQIPKMGLKPGEATAWSIVNTSNITGEVKGGITIIVVNHAS
jgi:hypothetical protein